MKIIRKWMFRFTVIVLVALVLLWHVVARPVFSPAHVALGHASKHIDVVELEQQVRHLSEDYFPRSHHFPENLNRLAKFVADYFSDHGGTVWQQNFSVDGLEYKNVVAEYGPVGAPLVVIGAHYDSAGPLPAADDNASGVVGLLQLGRLLANQKLNVHVMLVAFSLEEPPYFASENMGSAVFAKYLAEQSKNVELMISLEMIGYFSDEPGSQTYPMPLLKLLYPLTGNYIAIVDQIFSMQAQRLKKSMSEVISLPVYSINAPRSVPGIDFSDHRNFWAHGKSAVMVTDTAFYRNFAYHTLSDTADRLDYGKMADVIFGVFHHVRKMPAAR